MIEVDNILKNFSRNSPLFPLPNFILFPLAGHRFKIFESRYVQMIENIMNDQKLVTITLLKPGYEDQYKHSPEFNKIGTLGYIDECKKLKNNQYEVIIFGLKKVKIKEFNNKFLYREADLSIIEDQLTITDEDKLRARLISKFTDLIGVSRQSIDLEFINSNISSTEMLVNVICSMVPMDIYEKQKLLELDNICLRLELTIRFIESEIHNQNKSNDIIPGINMYPTLD